MNVSGTISWSINGAYSNDGSEVNLTFADTGVYVISAIGYNELNCPSEPVNYTIVVTSCDPLIYWVPNCFTPDGNEFNPVWGPVFTSGYSVNNFNLYVYNRWGGIVWESHNPISTWDGTYDGKHVLDGVYTWLIRFELLNTNEKREIHGYVTLLR
jgi:gliding motility-associated-like protein